MTELKLIYASLVFSTFIYALIAWTIIAKQAPMGTIEQELHQPVILVPMIMSLAMFAASRSGLWRVPARLSAFAPASSCAGPSSSR